MGPDDLDNILATTKADSKRRSALALYEGVGESDLVDEEIDERILGLLGLEEVFDIDYGTYVSLLKERLVASRNFDKKLSSEEDELLVGEFKRVKGKVGRFKLKKKKIAAESIGTTGPIKVSPSKFLLAGKAVVPDTLADSSEVKDISKALDEILKSLTEQNKETKKKESKERKEEENKKRRKKESDLEKPLALAKNLLKTVVKPFQSIIDKILRFITFTLLGYAFNNFVKWFSDPKNAKKVETIFRFLKDWWPTLLGAYVLFATPFGKFVRSVTGLLFKFTPKLLNFIKANPIASASTAAALATFGAEMWRQKEEKKQIEKEAKERNVKSEVVQREVTESKSSPLGMFGETFSKIGPLGLFNNGGLIRRKSFFGGGQVQPELNVNDIAFAGGGGINDNTGMRITGAGPDTQLIAAAPGEIVMSKKAVDKYGANFFLDLNKRAGGTNIPKIANNIQLAAGGGLIKRTIKTFQGGGMVGGALNQLGRFLPGTGSVIAPRYTEMGFQNKLLGIPLNRRVVNQQAGERLSPKAVQRYNQAPTAPSIIRPWSAYDSTQVSVPKSRGTSSGSFVGDAFKNFGTNVQTIKGAAKRQEEMMREMGVEPSGYVNLRGQPINMGPQSRSVAPGPPVIISRTTFTVLPPVKSPSKEPSISRGSKLPAFNISTESDSRSNIATKLGIRDLVGVS